jgi:hypothetical protein
LSNVFRWITTALNRIGWLDSLVLLIFLGKRYPKNIFFVIASDSPKLLLKKRAPSAQNPLMKPVTYSFFPINLSNQTVSSCKSHLADAQCC